MPLSPTIFYRLFGETYYRFPCGWYQFSSFLGFGWICYVWYEGAGALWSNGALLEEGTNGLHTTFVHLITIIIIFFRVMIIIATVFFSIISFGILGFCSTALFQNFKSLVFLFSANIGLFNFPFFLCEPSTFGYFLLSSSISPLYKSFTFLCNLFWLNIVQQVLPVCASKHLNCWLSGQGDQRVSCTKMAFGL